MNSISAIIFLFSNGASVVEFARTQYEETKAFIEDLLERFEKEALPQDEDAFLALCTEAETAHPQIRKRFGDSQNVFRDLFRFIIENPDKVREIVNLFRELFGVNAGSDAQTLSTEAVISKLVEKCIDCPARCDKALEDE